jgi:hypothetical protein
VSQISHITNPLANYLNGLLILWTAVKPVKIPFILIYP